MTPVGTALIGLSIGDSITWATRSGEQRLLTVLDVNAPQPA
jgi:regulator of nucleoside diphosphate kinase